jgi:UDP-GlcNAc:undecaprenyl-phosphate/decaprenyl-phosphate GlcNAc-1-phosphate transferase
MRSALWTALQALAAGSTALLLAVRSPGWSRPPLVRNFRGRTVPTSLGPALAAGLAVVAVTSVGGVARPGPGGDVVRALVLLAGIAALFVAGRFDDRQPGRTHGIRAHLGALTHGRVTSGIVKLLVATAAGLTWMLAIHTGPARLMLGTGVVAGCTNLWNLLDVRPGRALKLGLVAAVALAAVDPAVLAVGAAAVCLVLLPLDLRERGMLGDAGANPLGFVLGVLLVDRLAVAGLGVALAVLVLLHVLAETVTLSRLIEAVPPLRWFDRLGRLPAEPTAEKSPPSATSAGRNGDPA